MYEAHVSDKKKREVKGIKNLVEKYKVIGIINMCDLPALQLQRIKQRLEDVELKFTKKRLMKIAFDQLKDEKKNLVELKDKLQGMPALIFTDKDPFELAKIIKNNQSKAPARAGQTAPIDLVVPAGPTNFAAGPMIGELGALGIKSKVEGGKISIVNDKLLVEKGNVINSKQADLLGKLGIEPMKIGLNLLFTYKDGEILSKDVLFIDEELYINNLKRASSEAVALAMEIGYVVKDTAELLIVKAYREAKKLEEVAKVEEVKVEKPKEEVKEEPKPEPVVEKKPEPKEEIKEEIKKEPEPVVGKKEEPVKEEPKVEEEPEPELEPIKEEPKIEETKIEEPVIEKETPLEKEIKEQEKIVEEQAPKDKEDKVVIESKKDSFEEMSEKAKEILNNVVTEKLKKEGSPIDIKSSKLRERKQVDDVSKFINELKDKKSREEK